MKNFDQYTDKELLHQFKTLNDNKYLGILLQRYTYMLLGVCMKYLKDADQAKDAVQQVYEKVIIEIPKYEVDYFKSWIYIIAKNHCLVVLRKIDRFEEIDQNKINEINEQAENELLQAKENELNFLENALEKLNKEQKECVTLFYLNKKSYQDIAEEKNLTLMQVKSFIQNGKRNLKVIMEQMKLKNP